MIRCRTIEKLARLKTQCQKALLVCGNTQTWKMPGNVLMGVVTIIAVVIVGTDGLKRLPNDSQAAS